MKTDVHLRQYVVGFFSEREMFQAKVAENIKTHILCSKKSFYKNRVVYEIMWKNTIDSGRPQAI